MVDGDSHLLPLARHVVPNLVRAGMLTDAGALLRSSWLAMTGVERSAPWPAAEGLLADSTRC